MSLIIQKILVNTLDLLEQINFSGVEYYEPVNVFDTFIILASII